MKFFSDFFYDKAVIVYFSCSFQCFYFLLYSDKLLSFSRAFLICCHSPGALLLLCLVQLKHVQSISIKACHKDIRREYYHI